MSLTAPRTSPTLDRGAKDVDEGYGLVNADAAVALASGASFGGGGVSGTFGSGVFDARCWARNVSLDASVDFTFDLTVPNEGDFDIYLYDSSPGNYGNPQILLSSTNVGLGVDESISGTAPTDWEIYLVIKRVSGSGTWTLNGGMVIPTPNPTIYPGMELREWEQY